MVDVGDKLPTSRSATAACEVHVGTEVAQLISQNGIKKGDVLSVARLAGIMGSKRTSDLIPLCHPLQITYANVQCELDLQRAIVEVHSEVRCQGQTGVEMEALTACSIAALTVYDMCKAASKGITVERVRLTSKSGGKSGTFTL